MHAQARWLSIWTSLDTNETAWVAVNAAVRACVSPAPTQGLSGSDASSKTHLTLPNNTSSSASQSSSSDRKADKQRSSSPIAVATFRAAPCYVAGTVVEITTGGGDNAAARKRSGSQIDSIVVKLSRNARAFLQEQPGIAAASVRVPKSLTIIIATGDEVLSPATVVHAFVGWRLGRDEG